MNLKIVGLQTHEDESPLAFTVMFDDLDRGRRRDEANRELRE